MIKMHDGREVSRGEGMAEGGRGECKGGRVEKTPGDGGKGRRKGNKR